MTIFRFALKRVFRSPLNLLLVCALPVGFAFLPSAPGWQVPVGFHMYGGIILVSGFLMLRAVVEDGMSGILQRIGAAPVTHFRHLAETLLAYAVVLLIQNAVMVVLGVIIHGNRIPSPLLLLVAYGVFSTTSLALSLAGGSLFKNRDAVYTALSGVLMLIALVGGQFWPLDIMPPVMRRIAMATPCYWLIDATLCLVQGGAGGRYVLSLAIMLLFTVVFLLVGSRRRMT